MRKNYKKISIALLGFVLHNSISAQCGTTVTIGASSNMFTQIRNGTNPVAADKNLNTIVFAHRNNAAAFGGSSGHIRYDVSTNGGSTWTNNVGNLNPTLTNPARYPNALIYNPVGNVMPNNAYIGYLASTINSVSAAWNGVVTGVRQLSGTGNTENYNQPVVNTSLISHSLVKGQPGTYWAMDAMYNGTLVTGFNIYKGEWSGSDINWATNFTVTPAFSTAYDATAHVGDYNIAFDPTGMKGWFSFLGHLSTGPTNYAYYPIFYKTLDGGATWTGPIQVDLNQFSCITPNITTGNVVSTAFEHDLTVDVNGNPHLLTTVCNGNNAYAVFFASWHHMFDITQLNGVWNAVDIANVNAGRGTWSVTPNVSTMDMAPQVARTADGKKIFYTWSDNSTYTAGQANQSPNMFSKAFDVVANKWTPVKDFTSCNAGIAGKILFPHVAEEVLEPTATSYKFASVYGEFTVANDPGQVSNFRFLDGTTYAATDFSVTPATAAVTIQQGNTWLLCPTNTLGLSITGTYNQVLWSNGTITNSTTVNAAGMYIVTVRNGCTIGADTITVNTLTTSALASNTAICVGNSSTLSVTGNAYTYTWQPINSSATSTVVSPASTAIYTLSASGDGPCVDTKTVQVTVNTLPTLSVTSSPSVCAFSTATANVIGASTYSWSTGSTAQTISITPGVNGTYTVSATVTGTDVNACSNTATVSIAVNPQPTVTAVGSSTICSGQNATLTAGGASTYVWNTTATTAVIVVSPTTTTSYTVTGTNSFGCSNTGTVSQAVSPCTGIQNNIAVSAEVRVYPNPNTGNFILEIASISDNTYIEIYNSIGQVIAKQKLSALSNSININAFATGIYNLVLVENGQLIHRSNIVKQ